LSISFFGTAKHPMNPKSIVLLIAGLLAAVPAQAQLIRPELDGQTVYQVLLGELALRRGAVDLAAQSIAEAAKRTDDAGLLMRAIQVAGASKRIDLALDLSRRWVEREPANEHARQTLVGILAALGRVDEVAPHLRLMLAQDKESLPRKLNQLNRMLTWNGNREAMLRLIEEVTAPYRDLPEAQFAIGQAARAAGDTDKALAAARKAQALRPDWPQAVLLEVQVLGRERVPEAIVLLGRFLEKNPANVEIRLQRARFLAAERRWDEARAEFSRLLDKPAEGFDVAEALYPLAVMSMQLRDSEAAEKYYRQLLETSFADRSLVNYQLGLLADERKDFAAAAAYFEKVGAGEYFVAARAHIAQGLARQGSYAQARELLRGIEASDPQDKARVVVTEAQILREQRDFQGAFDLLEKALVGSPDQPDLLYDQAMVAERLNRPEVLEANLSRVIAMRPDNAHAYNALGYSFAERNIRLDEARSLIAKALELAPEDPFILDSMGWVMFRLGKPEEALRHLEHAYRMRQDPEIAAHMGEVMWALGRREDAKRVWREARQKNPDNDVLGAAIQKFAP
jgi:tetratricopeptide (TPR) repeat protein